MQAGLPEKVIQYFHCGSLARLESVVKSPQIRLICFTGSVAGGLQVQRAAADRVVPVGLELGGKDPAYLRADVDVKWAAEEIVDGAVFNSGQSCCSIERVYVADTIHDDFVAAVQEVLKGYKLGNPMDPSTNIGPVVSKKAVELIRGHVQDALTKGVCIFWSHSPLLLLSAKSRTHACGVNESHGLLRYVATFDQTLLSNADSKISIGS